MEKPVFFQTEDGVACITLNRPEKRNAINQDLLIHLFNYIDEVASSDTIQVAIITGKDSAFCSGLDLAAIGKENLLDPRGDGRELPDVMGGCKKPLIGAINGHAITGGLELALNCDFLIASELATFRDTHAKVGFQPGWGMTQLLQQAVGQRMAKEMSFTCKAISAEKALQCGLVNAVVPHSELLHRAKQIAQEICQARQNTLQAIKESIEYRNETTLNQAFAYERKRCKEFMNSLGG